MLTLKIFLTLLFATGIFTRLFYDAILKEQLPALITSFVLFVTTVVTGFVTIWTAIP